MNDTANLSGIALVDICGTLVDLNTLTEFVKFIHRTRVSGYIAWLLFSSALLANRLGLIGGISLRAVAVWSLYGIRHNALQAAADVFFESRCYARLNNELINHLNILKSRNHKIILVSATLCVIAKTFARKLNYDAVLATELEFKDQVATGSVLGVYCEQGEKVNRIKASFGGIEVEGVQISAYGNSVDDLPMLEWSKFPHVIWGAQELKKIAADREWPQGVHEMVDRYDVNSISDSRLPRKADC